MRFIIGIMIMRHSKEKGLEITVECNRKTVNYLDITLDLNNGSFQPYRKPNDETQ